MKKTHEELCQLCQGLTDHIQALGEELLEKNLYAPNGDILASVFVIHGPRTEEVTGMFREWVTKNGFKKVSTT